MVAGNKSQESYLEQEQLDPRADTVLSELEEWLEKQASKSAEEGDALSGSQSHKNLAEDIIIPITYNEIEDLLGRGTVGQVFKVRLQIKNQKLSANPPPKFALKTFPPRGIRTKHDFENEISLLQALAYRPHQHIVTHFASWTHGFSSYILFPLADDNLRSFLNTEPPPQINTKFTLWLLKQLKGLAEALDRLHGPHIDYGDSTEPVEIGFHHDLKPANILVFKQSGQEGVVLKICDFGSGRINVIIPQESCSSPCTSNPGTGDPAYCAPEILEEGKTSRPKDVWSFGCILIDILQWVFAGPYFTPDQFRLARMEFREGQYQGYSAFWYKDPKANKVLLKPPVEECLAHLRLKTRENIVFSGIYTLISKMILTDPRQRPNIGEICNGLATLLKEVN
ncbi:kinase-like protein [Glonium stellatum]|uniref:Kinase-like protein n=1 Tax=Glonium stellatum TaxID=574774 RepID=A0A8E2F433_9PEZI|nr:kinase-like protein [Glonium stellatum]